MLQNRIHLWFGLCMSLFMLWFIPTSAYSAEGRIPISSCSTISNSGSYILTDNLTSTCTCITVSADNVNIELDGHTITMTDTTTSCYGITAQDHTNITVQNGTITGGGVGVALFNTVTEGSHMIEGLKISGFSYAGVSISGSCSGNTSCVQVTIIRNIFKTGTGNFTANIVLSNVRSSYIEQNIMNGNYFGISIDNSYNVIVRKNTITNTESYGINVNNSNYNVIRENVVSFSKKSGIFINDSSGNAVMYNSSNRNTDRGIWVYRGSNNNIHGNTCTNNTTGIEIAGDGTAGIRSENNSIDWNQVAANSVMGIYFDVNTRNNVYSNNRTQGGGSGIVDDTCTTPPCDNIDGGNNF